MQTSCCNLRGGTTHGLYCFCNNRGKKSWINSSDHYGGLILRRGCLDWTACVHGSHFTGGPNYCVEKYYLIMLQTDLLHNIYSEYTLKRSACDKKLPLTIY